MFLVITYDVRADRTEIYKRLLAKFLMHEQHSVFAGNLTAAEYRKLRAKISAVACPEDRVLQFCAKNRHNIEACILVKHEGNGVLSERSLLHHNMNALIL